MNIASLGMNIASLGMNIATKKFDNFVLMQ